MESIVGLLVGQSMRLANFRSIGREWQNSFGFRLIEFDENNQDNSVSIFSIITR